MASTKAGTKYRIHALYAALILAALSWHYFFRPWGFYRATGAEESALRLESVHTAEGYLGCREADGSHRQIIDLYNSHVPLAVDYVVQYTDSWCAAFVSAVAIEQELTDIFPTECGCERQIQLWKKLGRWEESDAYIPQPGDLIYYDWEDSGKGDCTGWSDHVGMIVGIKYPFLKVIEGNKDDMVDYRILWINNKTIRGFALPDYKYKAAE